MVATYHYAINGDPMGFMGPILKAIVNPFQL